MDFENKKQKKTEKIGEIAGFVIMYFIFTTILYFLLYLIHKLPADWTYFHVIIITLFIVLVGALIKKLLK